MHNEFWLSSLTFTQGPMIIIRFKKNTHIFALCGMYAVFRIYHFIATVPSLMRFCVNKDWDSIITKQRARIKWTINNGTNEKQPNARGAHLLLLLLLSFWMQIFSYFCQATAMKIFHLHICQNIVEHLKRAKKRMRKQTKCKWMFKWRDSAYRRGKSIHVYLFIFVLVL